MKIDIIGAGPGGLFLALLIRQADRTVRVRVFERSPCDVVLGFGIVLDPDAQRALNATVPSLSESVSASLVTSRTITVDYQSVRLVSDGHEIGAMGRAALIAMLRDRAQALGAELVYGSEIQSVGQLDADLIVASDGAASLSRAQFAHVFEPELRRGSNWFLWCDVEQPTSGLMFSFRRAYGGWMWNQAYQYDQSHSTLILECDEVAYAGLQSAADTHEGRVLAAAAVFGGLAADSLRWVAPSSRGVSPWRQFPWVRCKRWHCGNVALMGDAAHTAHFSVGAGTKLALADAVALRDQLFGGTGTLEQRLSAYTSDRVSALSRVQWLAHNSDDWFEDRTDWGQLEPREFACSLLSRTKNPTFTAQQLRRMSKLAARPLGPTASKIMGSFALRAADAEAS